jgi:hypothetical protein
MRYQPHGTPWASCERVRGDNINIGSIAAHRRRPRVCRQSSPLAPGAEAVLEEDVEQSAPARSLQNLSAFGGAIKNSHYHCTPQSRYVKGLHQKNTQKHTHTRLDELRYVPNTHMAPKAQINTNYAPDGIY